MPEPQVVNLVEVVGSPYCVSSSDGERVYEIVAPLLASGMPVVLSFAGVTDLTTAFLNTAVGQLYGDLDESSIRSNLRVSDVEEDHLELLSRVVERAKAFFREPDRHTAAAAEAFPD